MEQHYNAVWAALEFLKASFHERFIPAKCEKISRKMN